MKTKSLLLLLVLFSGITLFAQQHKGKGQKATVTKTTKTYKSPKTNKTYKSTTVKVNKPNNSTKIVSVNRYPRNKVVVVKPRVVAESAPAMTLGIETFLSIKKPKTEMRI